MLDSNAFDELVELEADRRVVIRLARAGRIELFTTYSQEAELWRLAERKPEKYWRVASIPRRLVPSSVFVLDHTPLGSGRLGDGATYDAIRHGTNHVDDAVIADTAESEGMILVTNERRLRNRAVALTSLTVMRPAELLTQLRSMDSASPSE